MLGLSNIPENFDWQKAYFELSDKHHKALLQNIDLKKSAQNLSESLKRWTNLAGDKAPESDLAVLREYDELMIELANLTV